MTEDIDLKKYRSALDDLDVSDAEAEELLAVLWTITASFADHAFGLSPTAWLIENWAREAGAKGEDRVELKHSVSLEFNKREKDAAE